MKTMVLLFCSLVVLGVCTGCTNPTGNTAPGDPATITAAPGASDSGQISGTE